VCEGGRVSCQEGQATSRRRLPEKTRHTARAMTTEANTTLTSVTLSRASSFMSLPFDLRSQETFWAQFAARGGAN
jgi:hypothetical protein